MDSDDLLNCTYSVASHSFIRNIYLNLLGWNLLFWVTICFPVNIALLASSFYQTFHATTIYYMIVFEVGSYSLQVTSIQDEQGHISQTRLRVQDVFAMTDSPTKILTQWNRNNQPVGDSSSLLAGFLGQVASNFGNFPVLYESWTQVPEQYKNNVYVNTIQANFFVNDVEHKQYILGSLGKKWKDKRCRLFDKFYNWEQSVEENIENHPPHIPQDHWAIFVRYRRSAKTMEIANKNAANRAKLVIPHDLGSKTLARKRNELEVMHGREFSRAEMYQVSHKKPDGSFINEEARELHEKLQDELQNCSKMKLFESLWERTSGYVRGMGLGVSPSQVIGSSSRATSSTTSFESNERIEQMQAEINSLKAQVAEVDVLKQQIAFLMQRANRDRFRNRRRNHREIDIATVCATVIVTVAKCPRNNGSELNYLSFSDPPTGRGPRDSFPSGVAIFRHPKIGAMTTMLV
ncbi:hypothetical protein Fmac_026192 [Flemingia macrophylla]|uniref:Uncharacterized protein n=1 Tax=Flemingia macrophylla TaxID=520843 RepID=A0ABD1LEQ6_9FABA